jgi:alanine racemase
MATPARKTKTRELLPLKQRMSRPLIAKIHIAAMEHNLTVARQHNPTSRLWAVIKADGYGHGLERSMRGFANADGLSVTELDEALQLREQGWHKPILLLEGVNSASDLIRVQQGRMHTVVHCVEQIRMLEGAALARGDGPGIDVYLKINTGLNRLGFRPEQTAAAHARLRAVAAVSSISMMTHFANSYAVGKAHSGISVGEQARQFSALVQQLGGECSLCDSATVLTVPNTFADWIRPGVMLYGATCFPDVKASSLGLLPAMTLESEVIGVQHIAAGESVGYGSRFIADTDMVIGVVACGYINGYPRSAQDGAPILVDGIRTRVVGRVSMDKLTVDLTPAVNARVGSKVTLWGAGLPIEEVAHAANTICCELMCGVSNRARFIETPLPQEH